MNAAAPQCSGAAGRDPAPFRAFIHTHAAEVLAELSALLGTRLVVLDADGSVLCPTDGRSGPARDAPRLSVPLLCHGEQLGLLVAEAERPELQGLLLSLGEHIAERFRLEADLDRMTDQLAQSYDEINLLYSYARILRPERGHAVNARQLLHETAELLENRLLVLQQSEPRFSAWSAGPNLRLDPGQRWMVTNTATLERIGQEMAQPADDGAAPAHTRLPGTLHGPLGVIHYTAAPVRTGTAITGYVGILRSEGQEPFETGELRLLECLAEELGNAATARKLDRDLRGMLFQVVRSLVAAIDAKDEYTRGHSERVTRLSRLVGTRLGLSPAESQMLGWAALLHDIGKIAIKNEILNKPGQLDGDEIQAMRMHPERGCRVLEPIPQLHGALAAIRHHHERFDGRGYPDGLRGESIPLFARIIAVADAYDAMSSTRAYRRAHSSEFAMEEIAKGAGTQFDPALASIFQELAAAGALASAADDQASIELWPGEEQAA
ncbi:MAG: HD-GYP domain-containing protein [Candidatus Eisenbacteria bacterium]